MLKRSSNKQSRRQAWIGFLFVLPILVLFIVFRLIPLIGSVGISLFDYRLSGIGDFIGLSNFERLLGDAVFWKAMVTTLWYVAMYVPLVIIVAFSCAALLNQLRFGVGVARGILFLPYVTSYVLAGLVWKWVLAPDGLINGLISKWNWEKVPFLYGDSWLVLLSLVVVAVWKGFGYSMLILLAGMQAVPEELHEAAEVDGANARQRFFRITVPMLKPVVFFVLVIETIAGFQTFDAVYVMTGGGPARASYTVVYLLYETGFKYFDFGYASAIGIAVAIVIMAISLIQRKLLEDKDHD
uniref:carbohydrate ABC transporter permease n=1 Tax=Tessaracoccus timonensis TaxID=2161816 RepID=UPI000D54FB2D|nr:sugar ABC transporter permease [Tessaracoccus timonensis]